MTRGQGLAIAVTLGLAGLGAWAGSAAALDHAGTLPAAHTAGIFGGLLGLILPTAFGIAGGLLGGGPGFAAGYLLGKLFFAPTQVVESGRLDSLTPNITSNYGSPLNIAYGQIECSCVYLWAGDYDDRPVTRKVGAIFGFGGTKYVDHFYYGNALLQVCDNSSTTFRRIKANGMVIADRSPANTGAPYKYGPDTIQFYDGSQTAAPHTYAQAVGTANAPAYGGQTLIELVNLPLTEDFGNQYPQVVVEVINSGTVADASDSVAASGLTIADTDGAIPDPSAPGYAFMVADDRLSRVYLPTQSLVWIKDWAHDTDALAGALTKYGATLTDLQVGSASDPVINVDQFGNVWFYVGNTTIAGGWGGGGSNGILVGFDREGAFLGIYNIGQSFQNNVGPKILRGLSTQIVTWAVTAGTTYALLSRGDTWVLYEVTHGIAGSHSTVLSGSSDTETNLYQYAVDTTRNVLWMCGTDDNGFTRYLVRLDVGRAAISTHYLWHYTEGAKSSVYGASIQGIWFDRVRDVIHIAHGGDTISTVDPEDIEGVLADYSVTVAKKILTTTWLGLLDDETLTVEADPWLVLSDGSDTVFWDIDRAAEIRSYDTVVTVYDTVGQDGWNWGTATHTRVRFSRVSDTDIALSTVVSDICERDGLSGADIDVTALAAISVTGYLTRSDQTGAQKLEPLMSWYGVMMREHDFVLEFLPYPATDTPVATLDWDLLMTAGEDEYRNPVKVQRTRVAETELPLRVAITYLDTGYDYRSMTQYARRIRSVTGARDIQRVSYPIAASGDDAITVGQSILERAWQGADKLAAKGSPRYALLEPGDLIALPIDATDTVLTLLTSVETGADRSVELGGEAYTADAVYVDAPAAAIPGDAVPALTVEPVASVPVLGNLPALDGWGGDGFLFGVTPVRAGTVPGAQINRGAVGAGPSWTRWAVVGSAAAVQQGTVLVAPAYPDPWWERQGSETLRVAFPGAQTLTDRDADYLYNNPRANLLWVGGEAGTGGEVIQWETAALVSGTTSVYDLTGLHRGRWFSNFTIGVSVGDAAVLVPESGLVRARESGTDTYGYASDTIGDKTEGPDRSVTFANANRSAVPATPNLLDAEREPDGDYRIRMVARDRLGWRLRADGIAPPWTATEDIQISVADYVGGATVLDTLTRDATGVYETTLDGGVVALAINGPSDVSNPHLYWRLYFLGPYGTASFYNDGTVFDVEFRDAVGGSSINGDIVITYASQIYNGSHRAAYATDENPATRWAIAGFHSAWLRIEFSAPRTINEIVFGAQYGWGSVRVEYSDDDSNWTVDTQFGLRTLPDGGGVTLSRGGPITGSATFLAQQFNGAVLGDTLEVVV